MAIIKSKLTAGFSRPQLPSPYVAYQPVEVLLTHEFTAGLLAADTLELAYLPPNCRILSADVVTVGTGATTLSAGVMSGDVGSDDAARTTGTELFSAITPTTESKAAVAALAGIASADKARSIGVRFSANIAANPATKLHLRLRYATGRG